MSTTAVPTTVPPQVTPTLPPVSSFDITNQDLQCLTETTINKTEFEMAIYGAQRLYVPPVTVPPTPTTGEAFSLPATSPAAFDVEYVIPVVIEVSDPLGVNTNYLNSVKVEPIRAAVDDMNSYIRNLIVQVRGQLNGPSSFYHIKVYDIVTAEGATLEARVQARLAEVVADITTPTTVNGKVRTTINVVVGLERNEMFSTSVLNFINGSNLVVLSPGATTSTLNQQLPLNINVFRGTISDEVQLSLFRDLIARLQADPSDPTFSNLVRNIPTNLVIFYKSSDYGRRLQATLQTILPSLGITPFALPFTVTEEGRVLDPGFTLIGTEPGSPLTGSNTAFYVIAESNAELNDLISSSRLGLTTTLTQSQWFSNDLSAATATSTPVDSGIGPLYREIQLVSFVPIAPSPSYSPPVDPIPPLGPANFDESHLTTLPNDPSRYPGYTGTTSNIEGLNNILPRLQTFYDQLFYAYHRQWAERTILLDQRILQNVSDSLSSNRLPMFSYSAYDMVYLAILGYNNSPAKTATSIREQVRLESSLLVGATGWVHFTPQGNLPESYFTIPRQIYNNMSTDVFIHVIPQANPVDDFINYVLNLSTDI